MNCLDCGSYRGEHIFLWLSDELWKKIGCGPKDFLCAHCTIDRLQAVTTYIYAVEGRQKTSTIGAARLAITTQVIA